MEDESLSLQLFPRGSYDCFYRSVVQRKGQTTTGAIIKLPLAPPLTSSIVKGEKVDPPEIYLSFLSLF